MSRLEQKTKEQNEIVDLEGTVENNFRNVLGKKPVATEKQKEKLTSKIIRLGWLKRLPKL